MGEGPLAERIERMVAARLRLYEAAAPMARASVARARTNPIIGERLDRDPLLLRRQVEDMFGPELAALPRRPRRRWRPRSTCVLELESLEHLRRHRELSGRPRPQPGPGAGGHGPVGGVAA